MWSWERIQGAPEGWLAAGLTPKSAPLFSRHCFEEKVGINSNFLMLLKDGEKYGSKDHPGLSGV